MPSSRPDEQGLLAGLNAAIAAAERGARVVVLDKGKIERSGNIAGGVDHFMAYLESGEPWDTRDDYLRYVQEEGFGIVNVEIHNRVFCDELLEPGHVVPLAAEVRRRLGEERVEGLLLDMRGNPGGILNEGKRAFFPVMKKNSKMTETGGWEWYAFSADGKMLDKDPKKDCLSCHEGAKDSDYVLSKPLK